MQVPLRLRNPGRALDMLGGAGGVRAAIEHAHATNRDEILRNCGVNFGLFSESNFTSHLASAL